MSVADSSAGLWFSFYLDGEEYVAYITKAALCQCFHAADSSFGKLHRIYLANQSQIDAVARERFLAGAPRPIKLTAADFADGDPGLEKMPG